MKSRAAVIKLLSFDREIFYIGNTGCVQMAVLVVKAHPFQVSSMLTGTEFLF